MEKESTINIMEKISNSYTLQIASDNFDKKSFISFWTGYSFACKELGYINNSEYINIVHFLNFNF